MKTVLYILFGSPSSERKVSFSSKDYFYNLYKEYSPILIEWTKDDKFKVNKHILNLDELILLLQKTKSIVINSLHGEFGEDGYIQQIFALNQIEYTGSDSYSSMLSMNKYESNKLVSFLTNVVPTYKAYPNSFNRSSYQKYISDTFPIFLKPNKSGSSIGVYKIHSFTDLNEILSQLPNIEYLFQKEIKGIEVSIGCVKEKNEKFLDLPITEIRPHSEFFNYESKYTQNGTKEITPALISDDLTKRVKDLSIQIHNALGLGFYSRSDFIISDNKDIYYLETNSLPGMSKNSLLPKQLKY